MEQHEAALARLVDRCREDPSVVGVVLHGSVARGDERPDSDVDVSLVVTEERWAAAERTGLVAWVDHDLADYPGGYVDVKLVTEAYLEDAAQRGDDPVRDAFAEARTAWSRDPALVDLVGRVAVVPESQWEPRQASFLAQARIHGGYFLVQADERGDPVLVAHAALHLATSAARALLALNRVRFPGPKYLRAALARLERKPDGFDRALEDLLARPTAARGRVLLDLLEGAADWPLEPDATLSRFIVDNELAWRTRVPPPEYA